MLVGFSTSSSVARFDSSPYSAKLPNPTNLKSFRDDTSTLSNSKASSTLVICDV